ncbi:hypothetical protein HOLleu_43351 [Holothuria leucospilota]|uniref:OTU domain-containing protein n=1 Tax=Holothuria leucospilota TaxID=206669 RepID=A0A9Q0YBN5_HOLLE|nr:hypothetical protein HOLleu_43351 [Holothuria leucospilota]
MPKTKKASYRRRNKANKGRMQQRRLRNNACNIPVSRVIQNNGSVTKRSHEIEVIAANTGSTFHFFPVNDTWSDSMFHNLSAVSSLAQSPSINQTAIGNPQICHITAKPSVVKNIEGDGICFFRCLSYLITNSEENHLALRHQIVQSIQPTHLTSSSQTVQQYIHASNMDFPNVWSTEVEIMAAASLLQTDIYTYALQGNQWKRLRYPATGNLGTPVDKTKRAIYIVNTSSIHYDVIFAVNDSTSPTSDTHHIPSCKTTQLVKEEID